MISLLHSHSGLLREQIMLISGAAWPIASSGCKMHILEAVDLYRFYHADEEETLALRGVSLHVAAGEIVVVMGPSGSGKSTLLSCLAGLDEPDGGYVEVAGERITRRPEVIRAALRARWIGILWQSGNLFEHLTVTENVLAAQALVSGRSGPSAK